MPATEWETRLKSGRNDDCLCGSGKKYKKCHLRADEDEQSKALAAKAAEAAKNPNIDENGVDHTGHDHAPGEHGKPKFAGSANVVAAPKQPMVNKPVTTPRKAV